MGRLFEPHPLFDKGKRFDLGIGEIGRRRTFAVECFEMTAQKDHFFFGEIAILTHEMRNRDLPALALVARGEARPVLQPETRRFLEKFGILRKSGITPTDRTADPISPPENRVRKNKPFFSVELDPSVGQRVDFFFGKSKPDPQSDIMPARRKLLELRLRELADDFHWKRHSSTSSINVTTTFVAHVILVSVKNIYDEPTTRPKVPLMTSISDIAKTLEALKHIAPSGFALAMRINFTTPTYLFQTFSSEWSKHYSAKGYMFDDPVVVWGLNSSGVARWSDLTSGDQTIFHDAATYGLVYGVACATERTSAKSFGGFSRADREFTDSECSETHDLFETLDHQIGVFEALEPSAREQLRFFAAQVSVGI